MKIDHKMFTEIGMRAAEENMFWNIDREIQRAIKNQNLLLYIKGLIRAQEIIYNSLIKPEPNTTAAYLDNQNRQDVWYLD